MTYLALKNLIADEKNFDKLIRVLEKEGADYLERYWVNYILDDALSRTYKKMELYREDQQIAFSISGPAASVAAFAGNIRLLDYFIQKGFVYDEATDYDAGNKDFYFDSFTPNIIFYWLTETPDTYYLSKEHFFDLPPIAFTLPGGKLECFQLLMETGHKCDFRNMKNFKLLSMCRNKDFWEYLIDSKLLDPCLLLTAADYACHYRNKETASWLIRRYDLLQDYLL